MEQSFKQDRETQYNKFEFKNHNIQLLNGDFNPETVSLAGFEQKEKVMYLPTSFFEVVSSDLKGFGKDQSFLALNFDAKIHLIDQEARNNAVDGLIKKYHHLKNFSTALDLSKSQDKSS